MFVSEKRRRRESISFSVCVVIVVAVLLLLFFPRNGMGFLVVEQYTVCIEVLNNLPWNLFEQSKMSRVMRKPSYCIRENKLAD